MTPFFMRFGAILALVEGCSNQGSIYPLLSAFSELKFCLLRCFLTKVENMHFCLLSRNWNFKLDLDYQFETSALTPIFMIFGAILALVQGLSNQGWKDALL